MPTDKAELENVAKTIFKEFDCDNSGFIDGKEFEHALQQYNKNTKQKLSDAQIKKEATEFIQKVDQNADGKVSFKEFFDLILLLFKD